MIKVGFSKLLCESQYVDTISRISLSSNFSDDKLPLSPQDEKVLRETIKSGKVVYRGIAVMKNRVTADQYSELKSLEVGDEVPSWIASNNKNRFTSATSKQATAKGYAKGGHIELVIRATTSVDNTYVDLGEIPKSIIASEFDEDQLSYFKKDKEVLMRPNTKWVVHSINKR